jgi:glycosyltransferase involved in cell wall biosynthesis
MPSRTANSVHVARMCEAFSSLGCQVHLFIKRSHRTKETIKDRIEKHYGVHLGPTQIHSFYTPKPVADNLCIASMAAIFFVRNKSRPGLILSRNLYIAALLSLCRRTPFFFETHQLEPGFKKVLQSRIIKHSSVATIVISHALKKILAEYHGQGPACTMVLHDAAPDGVMPASQSEKVLILRRLSQWDLIKHYKIKAGYFGHLYPGRGVHIIKELAIRHPRVAFLLFGGNDHDICALKREQVPPNFFILGFLPPASTLETITAMDILLMPYQSKVSIGVKSQDTSRWMSPMKMFEYMAAGVPIIASDLPVLKEILQNNVNCLLSTPWDVNSWSMNLNRLTSDPELGIRLGRTAHAQYRKQYTWKQRARHLLDAAGLFDISE